jgi:excisionase family DNA binding protein
VLRSVHAAGIPRVAAVIGTVHENTCEQNSCFRATGRRTVTGNLLDRRETAGRLHVSIMTVRRLGAAGDLEEIRVGKRGIRITEESLERYLAGQRVIRSGTDPRAAA